MKKTTLLSIMLTLSLVFLVNGDGNAQWGSRWTGNQNVGPTARIFNPATIETIVGNIVSVEQTTSRNGMFYGLHALVQTGTEQINVHLGPGWFVENQNFPLQVGDQIEARGSRITFQNQPALVAIDVKKGSEILKLRDDNGFPLWSGRRAFMSNTTTGVQQWRGRRGMGPGPGLGRRGMELGPCMWQQ
jgi:hypothetical protein